MFTINNFSSNMLPWSYLTIFFFFFEFSIRAMAQLGIGLLGVVMGIKGIGGGRGGCRRYQVTIMFSVE